ncbi:MAG: AAA-like domain-containing protein, partial [Candidatus Parabeggiatoa sp.]|nr:AAA-like domain-containing protein [Candidatus Parabeggiatoa sp.]
MTPQETIPNVAYEYQVGASLPDNALTYVQRQADEYFYEGLKAGEFCYVMNARQMGKSSLRVRTMRRLQAEGFACAAIDLSTLGTSNVTQEKWYNGIIYAIIRSLDLQQFDFKSWDESHNHLSLVQRLSVFIDETLLVLVPQNIVIFVDESDSIRSLSFSVEDFFVFIRTCHNQRVDNPEYQRLTFAILGVASPPDLIQDTKRTPFNIGRAVDLTGFQLHEAQPLMTGLTAKAENPQAVLQAVLNWTAGQPFLTQKLCKLISQANNTPIPAKQEEAWVEQLVQTKVIEHWESQDDPAHLRTIRDRVLRSGGQHTGQLLGLYQRVLLEGAIFIDDSTKQLELHLSGLVVKRKGQLLVFNQIYSQVFNLNWVEKALANLRPYSEALTAWLGSNRQDESRLLRGQALQEAQVWAEGKNLGEQDYQFLTASQTSALKAQMQRRANRILTIFLIVALGLGGMAGWQWWESQQKGEQLTQKREQLEQNLIETERQKQRAIKSEKKAKISQLTTQSWFITHYPTVTNGYFDRGILLAAQAMQESNTLETQANLLHVLRSNPKLVTYLRGHYQKVIDVAFNPDGTRLASASLDATIIIWDVGTQRPIGKPLQDMGHIPVSIAFSPNGSQLVSVGAGTENNKIVIWDVNKQTPLAKPLKGESETIFRVAFNHDGKQFATASLDNTITI